MATKPKRPVVRADTARAVAYDTPYPYPCVSIFLTTFGGKTRASVNLRNRYVIRQIIDELEYALKETTDGV